LETFTIITTSPNGLVSSVHERMPLILTAEEAKGWLDEGVDDQIELIF
jgi:putative SOS response-associated peptidase YedK